MTKALTPADRATGGPPPKWMEADRLAALRSYGILDTPADGAFDDFVLLAAQACDAPIAVVNLIDEGRQWFAAEQGLGVRETALDISICAQAILQPGVFVVPDLTLDRRFDCNPLVTGDPKLRFYGGALLETADGLPLGTMCVLDYTPRPGGLTDRQAFTLQALARQVMMQLELRRALRQRTEAWAANTALLAEKDLLVLEVHHRVKNSLATVQALLLLQARSLANPAAAQSLRESAARVRTFGSMHEHLYRVGAAAVVDVAAYLRSLMDEQQTAFAAQLLGRAITCDAEPAEWSSMDAPALGLVVVELVTNALKYGAGTVHVTLRHAGDAARLTVEDAGRALPEDFDPVANAGFGMRVINGLLRGRRKGRLEVDRTRGHTCFVVTMSAPPEEPAGG